MRSLPSRSGSIRSISGPSATASDRALAYTAVVEAEPLMAMWADLLGGEPRCYDFRWPRFVRPGEGCGFHCDGPYMNRGAERLYSSWIPLGDVARHDGALMVLADSHRSTRAR